MINKNVSSVFTLKGTRTYVHGTSIFDELFNYLFVDHKAIVDIDISFKNKIINTVCEWQFSTDKQLISTLAGNCSGNFQNLGEVVYFSLKPEAQIHKSDSLEYDENSIVANSELSDKMAKLSLNTNYSFIENLVALTKQYHYQYHPITSLQWLFSRIQIEYFPQNIETLAIKLHSIIPNKLSKSEIHINQKPVGFIYFTVG